MIFFSSARRKQKGLSRRKHEEEGEAGGGARNFILLPSRVSFANIIDPAATPLTAGKAATFSSFSPCLKPEETLLSNSLPTTFRGNLEGECPPSEALLRPPPPLIPTLSILESGEGAGESGVGGGKEREWGGKLCNDISLVSGGEVTDEEENKEEAEKADDDHEEHASDQWSGVVETEAASRPSLKYVNLREEEKGAAAKAIHEEECSGFEVTPFHASSSVADDRDEEEAHPYSSRVESISVEGGERQVLQGLLLIPTAQDEREGETAAEEEGAGGSVEDLKYSPEQRDFCPSEDLSERSDGAAEKRKTDSLLEFDLEAAVADNDDDENRAEEEGDEESPEMNYFRSRFRRRARQSSFSSEASPVVPTSSSSSSSAQDYVSEATEAILRDVRRRRLEKQHLQQQQEEGRGRRRRRPSPDEEEDREKSSNLGDDKSYFNEIQSRDGKASYQQSVLGNSNSLDTRERAIGRDETYSTVEAPVVTSAKAATPEVDSIPTVTVSLAKTSSLRRRRRPTPEENENPTKKGNFDRRSNFAEGSVYDGNQESSTPTTPAPADSTSANVGEEGEDEIDPLGFIEIKSALQWKAMSSRVTWKFEEEDEKEIESEKYKEDTANKKGVVSAAPLKKSQKTSKSINFTLRPEGDSSAAASADSFKPTKIQQMRLVCWKVKPWKQPQSHQKNLFSTQFAAQWGVDCDEVYPGLFVGDKKSAGHVSFLQKMGITHVLNAAEGKDEGLVDLCQEHYGDSGITYLGFPLWDTSTCNIIPYLGCAAEFISLALDHGGKCLVNCQMGVSRSSSCAMAFLLIKRGLAAVDVLTRMRQMRDVRPNDGFLEQLVQLDNDLRKSRELGTEPSIKLSTLEDYELLPKEWNNEFWTRPMTEEEVGCPLVPLGEPRPLSLQQQQQSSVQNSQCTSYQASRLSSRVLSRRSSKKSQNSRRSSKSSRSISRHSSFKHSGNQQNNGSYNSSVNNISDEINSEDEDKENEGAGAMAPSPLTAEKLEQVKGIIEGPEERWRILWQRDRKSLGGTNGPTCDSPTSSLSSSLRSSAASSNRSAAAAGRVGIPNPVQPGVDEGDLLSMVKVSSAKQWKLISQKLSINLDGINLQEDLEDLENSSVGGKRPPTPTDFEDTTLQQLRLICWTTRPWDSPKPPHLFSSAMAAGWGVDCDEVYPGLFVGDEASARNIEFLQRMGITHVLNSAEGEWPQCNLVNLSSAYYSGRGISYQGLELWDSANCRILPYLGCANEFIASSLAGGGKCLVSGVAGVSRSCCCALAYTMLTLGWYAADALSEFRRMRGVRPSEHMLEQMAELDSDLRKKRQHGIPGKVNFYKLDSLSGKPRPIHFEYWDRVPEPGSLPFELKYLSNEQHKEDEEQQKDNEKSDMEILTDGARSSDTSSGDWEWEYYSTSSEDEKDEGESDSGNKRQAKAKDEKEVAPVEPPEQTPPPSFNAYLPTQRDLSCATEPVQKSPIIARRLPACDFVPTLERHLRLVCWKVKPWGREKKSERLYSTQLDPHWKDVDCDEVYPGIFISDAAAAGNVPFLLSQGVTHVLNTAEGQEEGLVDLSQEHYGDSGITYFGVPMWDCSWFDLSPFVNSAVSFMASASVGSGGRVVVNCQMGVSRSSTCVLAFLMKELGFTAVGALRQLRTYRDVRPNDGFIKYLVDLDNKLRRIREGFEP